MLSCVQQTKNIQVVDLVYKVQKSASLTTHA